MRSIWFSLCLSFLYSLPGEARPVASPQSVSSTDALIEAGSRALSSKDHRRAQESLEAAFLQDPSPAGLCRLAVLATAQGRQVAARDLFQRCLSALPTAAFPELRQLAQAALAKTPEPSGSISFLSAKGGYLWIDEWLTAKLPADERLTLQVAVGHHKLRLTLPGSPSSQSAEIDIKSDERLTARCEDRGISVLSPFGVMLFVQDEAGALWQSPEQLQRAWQVIDLAISQESGALLPLSTIQQLGTRSPQLLACRNQPNCQIALGKQAGATHVLVLKAQHRLGANLAGPVDYQMSSALLDTRVELPSDGKNAECTSCTEDALLARLAELAKRTFHDGLRPIGWLAVRTPRATVVVDGIPGGQTPYKHAMFTGAHKLTISRPYFEPALADVQVEQEETTTVDPRLVPLPRSRGERSARIGRWVFGGVGLAMMAVGAGLLARPDSYSTSDPPEEYVTQVSTRIPGSALLAGGGAALAISIALFATDAYYTSRRK